MTGTFTMIPHWLLAQGISARALTTYIDLARLGQLDPTTGEYEPISASNATLREQINISERTLRRRLDELEKLGAVQRVAQSGKSNVYRVIFGQGGEA